MNPSPTPNGASNVFVGTEMGTGTWAWGDRLVWGYSGKASDPDLREAFDASMRNSVRFFDTAELYGFGRSEKLIARFIRETNTTDAVVATKFFPYPWRIVGEQLILALRASLKRLNMKQVDLYQVHFPTPLGSPEKWAMALADALDQSLTRTVGVSNYGRGDVLRSQGVLEKRGYTLASNQVEYHLLNRAIERNGTKAVCEERGIRIIAYSPLAMGLLTGKYTPENLPSGARGMGAKTRLAEIQPLIALMREIAEARGKTIPQVALNWTICKGTIPIPGARNARQLEQNAGAMGWRLSDDEMARLDAMSDKVR